MEGIFATIGGVLFFLSWVLQMWETKKSRKPVISLNFFIIRLVGSILLIIESIKIKSFGFTLVTLGTTLMIVYNMMICIVPGRRKTKLSNMVRSSTHKVFKNSKMKLKQIRKKLVFPFR